MPYIRPYVAVDEDYVSQTSYTLDLDLPTAGLVSSMFLVCKARMSTSYAANEPFMKYLISSISVNQAGAAFLNSARPQAFEAAYYYKTGKMPKMGFKTFTDSLYDIEEIIPILFGEKVDDFDHYVDLSKLNDPKLSVTYDLATKGLQDRELWDTTYYPRFTVILNLIQGPGIPVSKGYLSLRQIESYSVANDLIEKIQLKGARPIKRLLIEDYVSTADYEFRNMLDKVRIWGDQEAWVPFDLNPRRWVHLIREKFGLCEAKYIVYYTSPNKFTDCVVAERVNYLTAPYEDTAHFPWLHGGSGLKANYNIIRISNGLAGEDIATPTYFQNVGVIPWNVGVIDMPKMLGRDFLDPTEHAPVYLEMDHNATAATYGETVRVNIEDLVKSL